MTKIIEYMDKKNWHLGYVEGWSSITINSLLFVMKLWAGILSGSIAMVADAWHTLSDSITSFMLILGFWIAARPADKKHPFGHGRAEFITAIIIGLLLAFAGFNFFYESVNKMVQQSNVRIFSLFAILIFSVSVVIKSILTIFAFWISKKTNSATVKADAWHHFSDAVASMLIVIGAIFGQNIFWIDSILGICVSILILYTAYEIIKNSSFILLGEIHSPELENNVKQIIYKAEPRIKDVHHFHLHKYGRHAELTVHVCLPANMSVNEAHYITEKIEDKIKNKLDMNTTVHVEPISI